LFLVISKPATVDLGDGTTRKGWSISARGFGFMYDSDPGPQEVRRLQTLLEKKERPPKRDQELTRVN